MQLAYKSAYKKCTKILNWLLLINGIVETVKQSTIYNLLGIQLKPLVV